MNSASWVALLHMLMPIFEYMIGMFILFVIVWLVGIRIMTQGKVLATFHKNHRKSGGLFKIDSDHNCIWLKGKGDKKAEKYNLIPEYMEWIDWPGGFVPSLFCVSIRSWEYVRYEKDPYSPEKHAAKVSARSNKYISDENVLGAVYRWSERSLGLGKGAQMSTMMIVILGIVMVGSIVSAYFSMQASQHATAAQAGLQAIQNALGVK